jgi:hypothetical protein
MPSPFPGMNPYLEQEDVWRDFYRCFIVTASAKFQIQLPPGFYARIDLHEYYYGSTDCLNSPQPDAVVNAKTNGPSAVRLSMTDCVRESYFQIHQVKDHEPVTAIKLLGPSIKLPGPHRDQYLVHRNKILRDSINFVEIDLLRGGNRLPGDDAPHSDYSVMVSRWQERPLATVWPIHLRQALPTIPVPLAEGVPDAQLDLQAVVNRVWDGGRYDYWIYQHPPDVPLAPEDAAWATQLIAGR